MRACWKILATALCATLTIAATSSVNAAEIAFSSQIDFTEIDLTIKDTYNVNPDSIALEVTLSQDAQQRMTAASSAALEQDLTMIIDGKAVSTSRVRNIVDTPQIRIIMSRQAAMELLPALLGVNPPVNPQAAPAAAAPAPASAPTPVVIPVPLLAAVPYAVETPQVAPLSPPETGAEAAVTSAPAMQEPDPAPAPAPTVPPDLAAMLADPPSPTSTAAAPEPVVAPLEAAIPTLMEATIPAPVEAAMQAPVEAAMPAPVAVVAAAVPPPPPAVLAIPAWALGAWLPTSATPSPYADINAGDPVAIFANAVDAITCNRASLSILESSNTRVRLQLAPNSQCVISGVQVDRLQISPAPTPGKIMISLYAAEDDMNGAPSKEGAYRRK
jgi:hypothetical protein